MLLSSDKETPHQESHGWPRILINEGSNEKMAFGEPQYILSEGKPIMVTAHGPNAWPGDLDGDGKLDLLTCVDWSVYPFYGHNALAMKTRPEFTVSPVEKITTQKR